MIFSLSIKTFVIYDLTMSLNIALLLLFIGKCASISSPIPPLSTHKNSAELQSNVADLWWTIDDAEREITFELHIQTTGWIALGISPGKNEYFIYYDQLLITLI